MINSDLTVYHKTIDNTTKLEKWEKKYYPKIWWYSQQGAIVNEGFNNSNKLNIRIWYNENENLNISDFAKGDILVQGKQNDITTQQDLKDLDVYNIIGINNNAFGSRPHIHLIGKS